MLKGLFVANKAEHAPPIHNLQRLARLADTQMSQKRNEQLVLITAFNIEARYPDLKRSFRKKCTKDYATEQIRVIKDIMKWLRETMNSKK
jgi:HEPN domain-containing protein